MTLYMWSVLWKQNYAFLYPKHSFKYRDSEKAVVWRQDNNIIQIEPNLQYAVLSGTCYYRERSPSSVFPKCFTFSMILMNWSKLACWSWWTQHHNARASSINNVCTARPEPKKYSGASDMNDDGGWERGELVSSVRKRNHKFKRVVSGGSVGWCSG